MNLTHCRGCRQQELEMVLDLGWQYLSDFYQTPDKRPPRASLALMRCGQCALVQLNHTVTREELYHERYGYASGVNPSIRANLAGIVMEMLLLQPQPKTWLDIASNDGTLLSFVPRDTIRVGIDPVKKFAAQARGHANLIIPDYFHPHHFTGQKFDVISSISMFYDLHDPSWFVGGVAKLLETNGVWVIQQNYLGDMLANTSFDNVCHEHLTYFSLKTLEQILQRHELRVFHVKRDPINGGCIRTYVCHNYSSAWAETPAVEEMRQIEYLTGVNDLVPWPEFTRRVGRITTEVAAIAGSYGQPIMLYGASTRGAVIWQASHLKPEWIAAAVEVQPGKIGSYYSAVGPIPIISAEEARRRKPPAMLVGPYWHRDLFLQQERDYLVGGGRLVFPIPMPVIYDKQGAHCLTPGCDIHDHGDPAID